MPSIIFNIPLYFTGITTYIYTELAPKLMATASVYLTLKKLSVVNECKCQYYL